MASPFQLIQERLFYDPWRLLIATIFLNKTRGVQARPVLFEFLKRFPTPEACVEADIEELAKLLYPLGLYNRRARSLVLFSKSYLDNFSRIQKLRASFEKRSPGAEETETSDEDEFQITKLYGIGQYGADSFHLFCEPESWRSIAVDDKELKRYVEWRRRVADD
ncbi:DNA glycosylase [Hyaloraphidium curvatum]|nr:DNA glycosylase [Hyaloraphidium curvatum]